jgi:hypothetical protein
VFGIILGNKIIHSFFNLHTIFIPDQVPVSTLGALSLYVIIFSNTVTRELCRHGEIALPACRQAILEYIHSPLRYLHIGTFLPGGSKTLTFGAVCIPTNKRKQNSLQLVGMATVVIGPFDESGCFLHVVVVINNWGVISIMSSHGQDVSV